MPTIQIRNVPEDLYEKLKSSAIRLRRSLTQEAIHLLEMQLARPREMIQNKRHLLRDANAALPSTDQIHIEQIVDWIREDRYK